MLVRGEWVDSTALYRARENGEDVTEEDFTTSETLELSPLPCYGTSLPPQRRRQFSSYPPEVPSGTDVIQRSRSSVSKPSSKRRFAGVAGTNWNRTPV